jgi:hypothetical protein
MIAILKRFAPRIAPLILAVGLSLTPAFSPTVHAQEPATPGEGEKSEGDPVPGYLGAGMLVMLVLFVVGKSARR